MSRYYNDFAAIDISKDELAHYGVLGMKWGHHKAKVATSKLNRKAKKAEKYQRISDTYSQLAKQTEYESKKAGPIAYGKAFNRIKKMKTTAKEYQRYAEYGRKSTAKYMKKLSKNYIVAYDVSTGSYSLQAKE